MESYAYPYTPPFPPMRPPEGDYPDHGDGFGDYYGMGPVNEERERWVGENWSYWIDLCE